MLRIKVESSQADVLKNSSQAFSEVLSSQVLSVGQGILFQDVPLVVTDLEPASPALVGSQTAVKIKLCHDPVALVCQHCGKSFGQARGSCPDCGCVADILTL